MRRRYHILDVFTSVPLAGNPLAVVLDSAGLDTVAMQKIAREFNLSETVFVSDPADPVNFARLRIFTPTTELPFAGHPTVGAAVLLAKLQAPDLLAAQDVGLTLEEGVGLVSCSVRHRRGEAAHASFDTPLLPEPAGEAPGSAEIAALLGLEAGDIGFGKHRPTRFSAGVPFTFVPVASLDVLGRVALRGTEPAIGRQAYYLYTPSGGGRAHGYRSRMLAAGLGVSEDPATGSAVAAFPGALLACEALPDGDHDCTFQQGVEMGRPSFIGLAVTIAGGRVIRAAIGGSAVMIAQGTLDL
jgi:trans-2,3-dihydro-3-hydroxyanthranilate isomerase